MVGYAAHTRNAQFEAAATMLTRKRNSQASAPGSLPARSNYQPVSKRNYVAARTVGSYVPALTRKAFEKYGFSTAVLLMDWDKIVGSSLAGVCLPERLKWPRGFENAPEADAGGEARPGATLILRVDPAAALDIEYRTRQVIDRINSYFGYAAVAALRLIQAPVAPLQPARATLAAFQPQPGPTAGAEDPLGQALARMQAGLRARGMRV
jgi:hypothetical protein